MLLSIEMFKGNGKVSKQSLGEYLNRVSSEPEYSRLHTSWINDSRRANSAFDSKAKTTKECENTDCGWQTAMDQYLVVKTPVKTLPIFEIVE